MIVIALSLADASHRSIYIKCDFKSLERLVINNNITISITIVRIVVSSSLM